MARHTKFAPVETPQGWRLNVPAKYSGTGQRQRLFYKTKAAALAAAKSMREQVSEFGAQARSISPMLAESAQAAADLLAPWNMTLLEAVKIAIGIRERESASKPLDAAVDLWMADCEGLRPKTQAGYRQTANRMKSALSGRLLASLTAEDIQEAIMPKGTPPTAAKGHWRNAGAFWRWSSSRGWCKPEVFDGIRLPKASADHSEIEILSPEQAERLLRTAEKHFPQAVASFALQLFAGIRAEELVRMEAENITAEGIDLPAAITKKGRRRFITPNDTLRGWLARFPFSPCPNWKRVERACRYLAGWKLAPDPDLVPQSLVRTQDEQDACSEWPQNALRHSHASYSVAAGASLESLLFEFGHAGGPNVLRQHYVGRASKKAALQYFAIAPTGAAAPSTIKTVRTA